MLIQHDAASLLVIDYQTRLAPAIHQGDEVLAHGSWLVRLAARLGLPTVITEHWPEKLGATVADILTAAPEARRVRKEAFSAWADGRLADTEVARRRQVVMCGTEAHVCVMQTALELRWAGKEVFIVAEACGSRQPHDRDLAFERMRHHGIEIVSREMVAFECLRRGGDARFSEINRDFIR